MTRWLFWLVLALVAARAPAAEPTTVEALLGAGRLQVDSALAPASGLVPGQRARLTLEIATDRWFSGGTRIVIPEVPGLVILQTEQFASNASENRGGQSWVVQRWTLDVYPQRPGDFVIGPIVMRIKINAAAVGNIEGEVSSPPVNFEVDIPPPLEQAQQWVAAPAFTATQGFDRNLEDLQVGDAFEREVVFEASDVMAMMLPAFSAQPAPGLAVYAEPPVLDDSSNRGQTRARRSQRISYVIEAEGQYLLPGQDYFWWDTASGELRMLSLPVVDFTVGAGVVAPQQSSTAADGRRQQLAVGAGLAILAGLLWLAWQRLPRRALVRLTAPLLQFWHWLAELRRPALPQRLNPDNNAGD